MMRDEVKDDWRGFHPKTNIFWLHYLLDKLIEEVPYKSTKSKPHRSGMAKLRQLKKKILEYDSAKQYVVENFTPLNSYI